MNDNLLDVYDALLRLYFEWCFAHGASVFPLLKSSLKFNFSGAQLLLSSGQVYHEMRGAKVLGAVVGFLL